MYEGSGSGSASLSCSALRVFRASKALRVGSLMFFGCKGLVFRG